jgi:type I restriction enzyme S subunit
MENNLPKGWVVVKAVDALYFLPTGIVDYSGTKDYYSTGSIQNNRFIPEGKFSYVDKPSRANRIAELGDVFQARMKDTDKGVLIDKNLKGQLFSTGFIQVRPFSDTFNNKLLYYLAKSDFFLNQKNRLATGSTQEALTDSKIGEIEIPLPPLSEQHRIVDKLDALMEKVERNKQRLDKIPTLLKRFRQSVLAAAVSGDGNEVSSKDVCSIIQIGPFGTQLHKQDYIKNGIPLINPMHIQNGLILEDMKYSITKEKFNTLSNYHLLMGDVIMGRRGEMARCALITKRENGWLCGTGSLFFRSNELILPEYLFLSLSNPSTKEFLENESLGTTMNNLNLGIANKIPINLPSIEKQKKIIENVHFLFEYANKIEARYTKAKAMLDKLSQSILAKAFRGELVPQNPEDEPASVLLERIRAEKMKIAETKKRAGGRKTHKT